MIEIRKESRLEQYTSVTELSVNDAQLLEKAKQALQGSYAPYSKFNVGCALLLANGKTITGSNQENIAYPSGLCAERVAVFYAGSQFPNVPIIAMAITAHAKTFTIEQPVMSCGACLQSISEYERRQGEPIRVILQGETGPIYIANGLHHFMPFMFWQQELHS
ncbi:MAG: cytidine deaminase [Bacteroidia bacterium]|jgi:cytidine deaminase|nr:cytidine deaminase [Bacteroidia bacterium]